MEIWNRNKDWGGNLKPLQNLSHFPIWATKLMLRCSSFVLNMRPEKVLESIGISRPFPVSRQARQTYFLFCLTQRQILTHMENLIQYFPKSVTYHCVVLSEMPNWKMYTSTWNDRSCWQISQKVVYPVLKASSWIFFFSIVSHFLTVSESL